MARTVVVTGAASGIGQATAQLLEEQGNKVIRIDLKEGDIAADLSNLDNIPGIVAKIEELSGGVLDGLVANAGVSAPASISLKVNYIGTVGLVEAVLPLLGKSENPRVSVTSSAATLQGNDPVLVALLLDGKFDEAIARGDALAAQGGRIGYANYSSSKRAISRWVRRVAPTEQFAGRGIGINAVGPGQVVTGMTKELFASKEGRKMAADAMPTPYNGISNAEDIGIVHTFLMDPRNRSMTGQVIFVDGGFDSLGRGDDIFTEATLGRHPS